MPDKTRGFLMPSNFSPTPYKNSKLLLNLVEAACRIIKQTTGSTTILKF
jgi:hypothetical protein